MYICGGKKVIFFLKICIVLNIKGLEITFTLLGLELLLPILVLAKIG